MDFTNIKFKLEQHKVDILEEIGNIVSEETKKNMALEQSQFNAELENAIQSLEELGAEADNISYEAGAIMRSLKDLLAPWS